MIIVNPEIAKQKQQIKYLEKKYQNLIFKRDEVLNEIEEFNNEYNLRFGELLENIFSLKEENIYKKIELYKLKKQRLLKDDNILKNLMEKKYKIKAKIDKLVLELKLNPEKIDLEVEKKELEIALNEVNSQIEFIESEKNRFQKESDIEDLEQELFESKEEKKEYQKEISEFEKIEKLNKEEKKELKLIYKNVSKLVHPDIVEEKYKNEANNLMAKVNMLYKLNKLSEMKKLYIEIKNKPFMFISDKIEDEDLQSEIYKMKDKIVEVQKEIDEIKANEIFEIIKNKENYFKEVEESLNQRLNDLKNEKSFIEINMEKYKELK